MLEMLTVSVLFDLFLLTMAVMTGMCRCDTLSRPCVTVLSRLCLLVLMFGQVFGALTKARIGKLKCLVTRTRCRVPWQFLGPGTLKP